jgi:aromatic ring-opening dioxygenase catalytic subunit (LigB family)
MARVIAGLASSHALALLQPDEWERRRQMTRGNFERRYGAVPPERPEIDDETLETNQARHKQLHGMLQHLRQRIAELRPDTIVLLGDDQDENFREDNLPQFAIYTGDHVKIEGQDPHQPASHGAVAEMISYPCDTTLSRAIHEGMVEDGFDLASSNKLADDRLRSHAHVQILRYMDLVDHPVPVVPIFVNAIHLPAPTPARCFDFGAGLRRVIEAQPCDQRVLVYASGGLSHYTAGFPWESYQGPATLGYIDADFDRRVVDWMQQGRGSQVRTLTSADVLNSGNIEMRQWIVLMGVLGDGVAPTKLVYEPFFRGLMGMAAGAWELEKQAATV